MIINRDWESIRSHYDRTAHDAHFKENKGVNPGMSILEYEASSV